MDPLLGYGLISGVGSLASSLWNQVQGQKMSKDLMRYQYELNQRAVDKANAYNTPANQMKRLEAAQLNPNLVYGHGADGNQSSAANVSMANRQGTMENPLQDMGQAYLQSEQLKLQKIAARNEAFESRARRLNLEAKTLGQLIDNSFNDKTMNVRIKSLTQKLANDLQTQKNLEAQEALTWSKTRNEDNRLNQIWAEIDNLKAKKNLTEEQAATEVVKRASLRAGIRLTEKQIEQAVHYIRYLDAGSDLREQQHEIQALDFESSDELDKFLREHPNVELTKEIIDYIFDKANGKSKGKLKKTRKRKG